MRQAPTPTPPRLQRRKLSRRTSPQRRSRTRPRHRRSTAPARGGRRRWLRRSFDAAPAADSPDEGFAHSTPRTTRPTLTTEPAADSDARRPTCRPPRPESSADDPWAAFDELAPPSGAVASPRQTRRRHRQPRRDRGRAPMPTMPTRRLRQLTMGLLRSRRRQWRKLRRRCRRSDPAAAEAAPAPTRGFAAFDTTTAVELRRI